MPYSNHWRVTASGVIGTVASPLEIWSCGFALGNPGTHTDEWEPLDGSGQLNQDDDRPTICQKFKDFLCSPDTAIDPDARVTQIKIAKIGVDGKYADVPYVTFWDAAGGDSGSPKVRYPMQIALAVSLQGPPAVKRVNGRFYLPAPAAPLTTIARTFNPNTCDAIAGRLKVMIDDINNLDTANRVIVASTKGFNARVETVRVGIVPDTIRTRRNKQKEDYKVRQIPS